MRILLLLFFSCQLVCFSQPDSYFLIDNYFKGMPKKVTTLTYDVFLDSLNGKEILSQQNEIQVDFFNLAGLCTLHQWLDTNFSINSEYKFVYDDEGNRIENFYYRPKFDLRKVISIFDTHGHEIETVSFDTLDNIISQIFFLIETNDSIQTRITLNSNKKPLKKVVTYLSGSGKIKQEDVYKNATLFLDKSIQYEYDKVGRLTQVMTIDQPEDTVLTTYKYDSLSRKVEFKLLESRHWFSSYYETTNYIDSLGKIERTIYRYNEKSRKIITFFDSNNCIIKRVEEELVYPVLMGGDEDETLTTKPTTRIREMQYIYDENLNWIAKIEFYQGRKYRIKKREFQY